METAFTELIGCRVPVQLAPMGGMCTPELSAAVANGGGVGMLSLPLTSPAEVAAALDAVDCQTAGPVGVSFLVPFLDPECLAVAAGRAPLIDFFYGDPDPTLVAAGRAHGALVSWQVASVAEARAAVEAGCDVVVAQGIEAGGRHRGSLPLAELLAGVVAAVRVPVLAAGGIGSARDVAACLAAGASGVRLGTRFLAASESAAHPSYRAALVEASAEDTVRTSAFSIGWPGGPEPHRVLRSCVEAATAFPDEVTGSLRIGDRTLTLPRFGFPPPTLGASGAIAAMALYAGTSVGAVSTIAPAAEILEEVVGTPTGGTR
jgi:NAD(P)H-dependent flavin oxidoreductase YrpB (nitropropane dioxygenase family)